MQISENNFKPSLFDDAGPNEDIPFWRSITASTKKLSEVKHMEGILFKRSKKTNFWKSRYYRLFDDRLAYFKNGRECKETAFCVVQNMRIQKLNSFESEKEGKFGIRLIHNRKCMDLYARSGDVQDKWVSKFKMFCVQLDYTSCYSTEKMLGEGSFAKVYLSKSKFNGSELAVKTFDKALLSRVEKSQTSLINEVNIMRKLDNENIIKLFEVFESDSYVYLVLELLHGGDLYERITEKGIYSEGDAAILMEKLLSALECMHSNNLMHRDIKPENLILNGTDNDFDIKIADFGLAVVVNSDDYLFKRCGTPGYIAPEILADEKYDQKVDVFSSGVILYILLSGVSPFDAKSYNKILIKNKRCEIDFNFEERGLQISAQAIDLLRKMLKKDPKARISAKDALNHPWILSKGAFDDQEKEPAAFLNSVQENMEKFQEKHHFDMKSIKPKNIDSVAAIQRSLHCPSPVVTLRSPVHVEPKRMQVSAFNESKSITNQSEGMDQIGESLSNYKLNFNRLGQSREGVSASINSSGSTVSEMKFRVVKRNTDAIKARHAQGNLLNLLKQNEQKSSFAVPEFSKKNNQTEKVVSALRNNLKNLY